MKKHIALAAALATFAVAPSVFAQSESSLMDIVVSELRASNISTEGVENLNEQSLAELATLLGATDEAQRNDHHHGGESSVEKKREIENFIAQHQ